LKNYLPLKKIPFSRLGRIGELLEWRLNPISQKELDRIRKYDRISVPCFHECGWYDGAGWSQFENFCNLREQAATKIAREGQHIVVGPWPHGMLFQSSLGGLNFGYAADSLGSGLHQLQIAFFDKYVRDMEIDLPIVRYFVMGRNQWRTADSWPLPGTDWQRYYLHSNGHANSAAGDGVLGREIPGDESPDRFDYDPHEPVPTAGGPLIGALPLPGVLAGPLDQHHVEKRNDVLCYTTPAIESDLEITGPLQLHLFAATSAVDTDFTAKLVHVYPDGQAYNLAEGIIRASGRELTGEREAVKPGEVYEYVITLGNTSQLIPRGHRLRVDVSSSNFPLFDRNMNTGNPIGVDAEGVIATQTIYHQENYASYIDLPVIPA
jgi:putative CocE/NonD family hydrolase